MSGSLRAIAVLLVILVAVCTLVGAWVALGLSLAGLVCTGLAMWFEHRSDT